MHFRTRRDTADYSDNVEDVRLKPKLGLLCLLLAAIPSALALDPAKALTQDAHRVWGLEDGLFQPTVYAILQTRDGFLWLGTQDSLIRFDGAHFREFEAPGGPVLHGSLVHALLEDQGGTLWVATIGNGLGRIAPGQSFSRVLGLPSENVFCLDGGAGDSIFACTDKGLVRISRGGVQTVTSTPSRATCATQDGTRWLASFDGNLVPLGGSPVRGLSGVTTLACDRDTLWAGGSDGLVRIRNRRIDLKLDTRAGMPDNAVAALSSTPDGSLWIGSDDGVSRWRNGELSVYGTRDGLSHSVVLSVFVDREGTLWTGTKDGLDQFTDPKFTPYSKTEGLSSNEVGPVMQDRAGLLWIGTLDHGIDIFDGRRFRNINLRSGLLSNRVLALAEDTDGSVWAGTDEGVNRITAGLVEKAAWDRGKSVRALSSDAAGTLWIATSQGVDRLAKGVLRHENDSAVFGFVPETPPGIANNSRPISCFLRGGEGSIWMGTLGSGLVRWRNGAVARMHVKDGLYDNRIYQLLRDDRANIWMASSKGIFRIAESELNAFADGKVRSVTSIPFTTGQLRFECRSGVQPAAWRTRDGRLWFATTTGLVVIDPNHLVTNTVQPPAQITSLFVDGERTPLHEVSIQPWQKNLEIRYAGLSFLLPEKVTFRYLLDGYDKRWVDAGARREAFYSNLPPGHFRFRVRARNADGVWGEEAAALAFTVQPRVYQRWWFWPALTALAGLAIYLGYRRRVRRLQRTFSLLLAERGRIARELHDTLLQGIAGVTMQLQALWNRMPAGNDKRVLREILEDASRCAAEARQSLWGLRAPSASARFSARMGQVCREAVAGTRLGLELALDETAAAPPEIEYQLLRIAQEAIANAVHHAEADHLRVRLKAADGGLTLSVTDDGRGFSTTTDFSSMGHFGLVGMRERAAEIGAELTISSGASGTIVCARVRYPESGQHSPEGSKQAKESAYEPSHTNPVG